ncbi:MAG: transketolase C-terminal domain-containing protein [Sphaerochaetaceae bacterium]|nr:transketolase C-terminal domain-containing protein [Sphaerochaetaceae bacterium]
MIANRIAYGNAVHDMAKENDKIVVVDADCIGPLNYGDFRRDFPERFIECGIAEQDMVSIACGLASCGKTSFVGSFAVFPTLRAIEQVRNMIAYNNFDVKVIGTHAGVETGYDGATHEAIEDVAVMRAIPNIRILAPSSPIMTYKLTCLMGKEYGPFYMRFGKNPNEEIYTEDNEFKIGGSVRIEEGSDCTIMTYGRMVGRCKEASDILRKEGISVRVCDMYSIKPIDTEQIDNAMKNTKFILTVEDHNVIGGLGGAVCEYVSQNGGFPVYRHGIMDHFGRSGIADDLFELYGLTAEKIAQKVRELT